jgi:membrane-associated phospholipid phosphatase
MMRPFGSFCVCTSLSVTIVAGSAGPVAAQTRGPDPVPRGGVETANLAPAAEIPNLKSVITDTVTDFRNLPTRESATWLTLGLIGASIAQSLDGSMTRALGGSEKVDGFFAPGETIGGARFQLAGALATYSVGLLTGHPRVAEVGADLVRANLLAQAMTASIKLSVRRGRPDGTRFSFPSGHASVSFAAATVVQRHFGWTAGVPAYAAASYIAASRIQEKRHFLSDVAFGAVVGIVAGRTVTVGRGDHRFAIEPMVPNSGGVGIAFVKR